MSRPNKIPHFSSWPIVKEEFTGHWQMIGENYLHGAKPLMEITRCQNINGEMHVVTTLEWGKSMRFHGTHSNGHEILVNNHFLLETLWRAQYAADNLLPKPACRPSINILEESDRQRSKTKKAK